MTHENNITVERDGQHFIESTVEPGKVLEGPFPTADLALKRSIERSNEEPVEDQDLLDGGVVLGGVDNENHVAGKLGDINRNTGTTPAQVVEQSYSDPTIRDDLLSDRTVTPRAYAKATAQALPKDEGSHFVTRADPDGTEFTVEVKADGSEFLRGRVGQEGGVGTMIKGPDRAPEGDVDQPGKVPPDTKPTDEPGFLTDIGRGILEGLDTAAEEVFKTVGLKEFGDWLDQTFPWAVIQVSKPERLGGNIASGVTQGGIAMLPILKGMRALGVASSFIRWTVAGAVADFAAFSPDDPALGDLAKALGKLDTPELEAVRSIFADALAKDDDDSEIEKRLKAAAGGALIGAALDGLMGLYRGSKGIIKLAKGGKLDPLLLSGGGAAILDQLLNADEADAGMASKIIQLLAKEGLKPAEPFFAKSLRTVMESRNAKASGDQWRATLKNAGIKDEEFTWLGLDDFLVGKSITRTDLEGFIRGNQIKLEEAVLGPGNFRFNSNAEYEANINAATSRGDFDQADVLTREQEAFAGVPPDGADAPKFAEFTLPGGTNYREMLLIMPQPKGPAHAEWMKFTKEMEGKYGPDYWNRRALTDAENDKLLSLHRASGNGAGDPSFQFIGTHWDHPNVLAHVRFNERIDAEGKRVLFIEEIQSDWMQQGRRKGFKPSAERMLELDTRRLELEQIGADTPGGSADIPAKVKQEWADVMNELQPNNASRVPDAPFKKTWHELMFKRMVRYGAENDFDRVAWTTGAQQADRYDLSKQIQSIGYQRRGELTNITVWGKEGNQVLNNQSADADWLVNNLGKDIADRIASGTGRQEGDFRFLEDLDLKVGGEGMIAFYDKMVPNFARKLGKKFDAKVGTVNFPGQSGDEGFALIKEISAASDVTERRLARDIREGMSADDLGVTVEELNVMRVAAMGGQEKLAAHSMDITDKLRDVALREGFPLFGAAAVPLAASGNEGGETQVAGILDKIIKPLARRIRQITPKDAILARISKKGSKPRKRRWNNFYKDIVDDLDPLNRTVKNAIRGGRALAVGDDPYKLARLNRGVNGKAEHFLEYSPFKFGTFENVGKSLKEILEPVKDNLDDFRAYAVAKRSLELGERGITTGVPKEAAEKTVAEMADRMEPIFRQTVEFQDHVLNYLRDAGVLSEKAVKAMREANRDYVPFFRLMDDPPGGGSLGRGFGVRQPVKKIKGSERPIIDPLESIVKNTYLYLQLADRNAVGDALLRLGELHPDGATIAKVVPAPRVPTNVTAKETLAANPEIKQLLEQYSDAGGTNITAQDFAVFRPNSFNIGPNQIAVYRDGKRLIVEVDREIADTFRALDGESANMLIKIMGFPARMLRAGAVLSPEFIGRNPIRDQLSAFIFSEKGFVPFLDLGKGIFHMIKKDKVFKDWIKSGGPMASLVSLDRTYLQQNIRQIIGQTTLGEKVINVVRSPIEALRILSDMAERGTRLGEFARVAGQAPGKEAIQTGGFASREVTLDFQRIGAKTRSVNALISFFNANIQGQDKVIRQFINNPLRTTARIGAGITLPSVTLHAINRKFHDDPDDPSRYSNIPQWVRDLFWNVRVGDTWWRIPKPFEVGIIFGTGAERITDFILKRDPKAFDGLLKTMGRGATPGFLPTVMSAPIETWANRSLFSDRPIIPADRERLLPEYQYSNYTTEIAKALGKLIAQIPVIGDTQAASPAILENWVRSWTGGLGMHIVHAADLALRKTGVLPDPSTPAKTLADIPFIKGFVVRHPTAGAEPINRFFKDFEKQQKTQLTIKALVKEGDADEAIKVMSEAVEEGQMTELTGIKNALTSMSKTIRAIWKNPEITPDEKRQMIDNIYNQMIGVSVLGNDIIKMGIQQGKEASELLKTNPIPGPTAPAAPKSLDQIINQGTP